MKLSVTITIRAVKDAQGSIWVEEGSQPLAEGLTIVASRTINFDLKGTYDQSLDLEADQIFCESRAGLPGYDHKGNPKETKAGTVNIGGVEIPAFSL